MFQHRSFSVSSQDVWADVDTLGSLWYIKWNTFHRIFLWTVGRIRRWYVERINWYLCSRGDSWTFSWVWLSRLTDSGQLAVQMYPKWSPNAPSAPEACSPQMVPFLLPIQALHDSTEQRAGRCRTQRHHSTRRQIAPFDSLHRADAHGWTCGSRTSSHRHLYCSLLRKVSACLPLYHVYLDFERRRYILNRWICKSATRTFSFHIVCYSQ